MTFFITDGTGFDKNQAPEFLTIVIVTVKSSGQRKDLQTTIAWVAE
jgi:hypothetical protein